MTDLIQCDTLVFQTLDDLKDACLEAKDEKSEVNDFEVGVFCGQYKTPVPDDYFPHANGVDGNKKRKSAAITQVGGDSDAVLVASSGPVNVKLPRGSMDEAISKGPEYREDVRYVDTNNSLSVYLGANDLTVFITLQAGLKMGHFHEKEARRIFCG